MNNAISLYQQRLNLENAIFTRIEHVDAIVAIVYKITQPTGADLILKICSRANDYLREVYCLNHFAGLLKVPRIIDVVAPQEDVDGAVLMECLPGAVLELADLTYALAYEIGSQLALIHLKRVSGYGDLIEPETLSADPRAYFGIKFEEGFAECSGNLPKALLDQCRNYYEKHIDLLIAEADGPCVTHRDFRPGNVIVCDGKLRGIIDWSSARASFAQEDFSSLELGKWSTNPAHKKSFLDGYASIRPVPNYGATMPLLRMSSAFATLGFLVKSGTWNNSHASIYQTNRQFLESFLTKLLSN